MTKPFFIVQYVSSLIWILESLVEFGLAMIFFSAATTTVNYVLLYLSYRKIKEKAELQFEVKVIREGRIKEVLNIDLVPGDLYLPTQ